MGTIKTIDDKGRLTLGREFAGRHVQVSAHASEMRITFCKVVPDREAWLWDNDDALKSVRRGLRQAHDGQLTPGPDMESALGLAAGIADDDE